MPQIPFNSKYKSRSFFDFPKLKLKKGEKARITVLEFPVMEHVHNLRKIIIEGGEVQTTVETYGPNNDKQREVPKADFVGKFICLGDAEVLDKDGIDPANCPACKAAVENVSAVEQPKRRFVMHVLKYQVKKGSFDLQKPFQAEVLAWELSENRFNQLVDINDEYEDIRKVDLILGPCEIENFQKYAIAVGNGYTLSDADHRAKAAEIIQSQRAEDLSPMLGRKVTPAELQANVTDILRTWDRGYGTTSAPAEAGSKSAGPLDFSSLAKAKKSEPEATQDEDAAEGEAQESAPPADAPSLESFAQDSATPTEPEQPQKVTKTTEVPSLDDLMANLG